jgi:hypothetical protein
MIPTDPLESLPLPPGDPGALADEARQMADWSVALGDCGDHQERAVAAIAGSTWKGLGAASARGGAHQVIGGYRQAGHALTRAGALLQGCAQDWDGARSRYAQARMVADEALYDEARKAMASPSCLANPPASPWESPLRDHAQALARAAIDDFDAAANRTARELQELAGDIGRIPAFLPRHHHHWYEEPLQWAADGEHLVANGVSHAFDPFRYALSHPGDALQVASDALQAGGGLALTAAGGVGFGAGVLLDGSVIGIPAGVAVDATSVAAVAGGAALSMHGITNGLGDVSNLYSKSTSGPSSVPPRASAGSLEGRTEYQVNDPNNRGRTITDIDRVENGVLWEEKSATQVPNPAVWIQEKVYNKFASYLEARSHMPGYENAPIGFDFTEPGAAPKFRAAVTALRTANPEVRIYLRWRE